jgi:signal transduction histidine kinase
MHQWLPPTAALLALAMSFPLWNSRRLDNALKYLGTELKRLTAYELTPQTPTRASLEASLESLVNILGLSGWCISDPEGRPIAQHGQCLSSVTAPVLRGTWTRNGDYMQTAITDGENRLLLAVHLQSGKPLAASELALLDRLIQRHTAREEPVTFSSSELVQTRIEQVQQATERVRSMYQFIDDSLAQMADGILVTDEFGVVTLQNDKAQRFLDVENQHSFRGQDAAQALHSLGQYDQIDWNGYLKQVLLEKTSAQLKTRNQAGLDLMVQITPISHSPDSPVGAIIILSDISELKNSERRRIEAVSFLSHDLRSPMVSLLALVELARARGFSEEQQQLLNRMDDYANRAIHLSEQFLQLARAESDDELVFSEVNLLDIINSAREEVWGMAQARKMRLDVETELDEAWIHGNADLLGRSITNLLTNAIKYSPENGVISIQLHEAQQEYRCCVQDQGHGIPAEELSTLFNRFQRGSLWKLSAQSGAGLGLALVKATVQRHHGRVDVSSTPGKGSRFCIALPAGEPAS